MVSLLSGALNALLDALSGRAKSPTAANGVCYSTVASTSRLYTIHYTRSNSSATTHFSAEEEDEIVDWTTEIIDSDDGRVQCVTTPVYARKSVVETIETAELLDMAELLARANVRSVTCEEITRTTRTVQTAVTTKTTTVGGSRAESVRAVSDPGSAMDIQQLGLFGMPPAFGCVVRRLLDA